MKGVFAGIATIAIASILAFPAEPQLSEAVGISAKYPGDVGIDKDESVIFVERFETGGIGDLKNHWDDISNKDGKVMSFSEDVSESSSGKRSLKVTTTRDENTGGHLFRVFKPGSDRLYVRFYCKFAEDCGFCHHFVRVRGMIDPVPYPLGQITKEPSIRWCGTDIEPLGAGFQLNRPGTPLSPPGIWALSAYWPDMRSWQGQGGTGFYSNLFESEQSVSVPRSRWVCVEVMVKMNSSTDKSDGEQAFWIDGDLVAHFGPGTVNGYWRRDKFILDDENGEPFEGFRWRQDMRLNWNRLWLLYYISESTFKETEQYAAEYPDLKINTRTAAVWFDDIVVAKKYVGTIKN